MDATPQDPQPLNDKKKKDSGCMFFLVRAVIVVAVVLAIDYAVSAIFHSAYPPDEVTTGLQPFQNQYLATTDAFITSEATTTEFTDDPGAAARFLSRCIFPFVGVFLLFVIIAMIPFTEKLAPYMIHTMVIAMILLMIDSLFFPPVLTEFDRERRVMIVHKPEWIFFGTKTEIPFSDITGFTHEIEAKDGNDHYDDLVYADLFATTTTNGKIFIGENQLNRYTHEDGEVIPVSRQQRLDIARALDALRKIIK